MFELFGPATRGKHARDEKIIANTIRIAEIDARIAGSISQLVGFGANAASDPSIAVANGRTKDIRVSARLIQANCLSNIFSNVLILSI
jgi:hypothetical protein